MATKGTRLWRCIAVAQDQCNITLVIHGRDSSVGRASDRRSEGPRFDPGSRHDDIRARRVGSSGCRKRREPIVAQRSASGPHIGNVNCTAQCVASRAAMPSCEHAAANSKAGSAPKLVASHSWAWRARGAADCGRAWECPRCLLHRWAQRCRFAMPRPCASAALRRARTGAAPCPSTRWAAAASRGPPPAPARACARAVVGRAGRPQAQSRRRAHDAGQRAPKGSTWKKACVTATAQLVP